MHNAALRILIAMVVSLVVVVGLITSAMAEGGRWTAPNGDFSVWAPTDFETGWGDEKDNAQAKRDGVERYMAVKDGKVFLLETIPVETDDMDDIEKEIPKKDEEYKFEKPKVAKGDNWEGRRFFATKGEDKMLELVVIENSRSEIIRLTTNDDGAIGERFLNSLEVDTDKAKARVAAYNTAVSDRFWHPQTPLEVFGLFGLIMGLLGLGVSTVWLIILGFQRNVWWGIGMIFIPLVRLIFVCMHWRQSWVPFLVGFGSIVLLVAGAINMPHL
jgi:NACalpha-BTF3-like transcription factor